MMSAPYRRWTNIERNLTPDFLPRGAGIVRHEVEHGLIGKRHETIMLLVHICFSNLVMHPGNRYAAFVRWSVGHGAQPLANWQH